VRYENPFSEIHSLWDEVTVPTNYKEIIWLWSACGQNFTPEIRNIRKKLIPYLKNMKRTQSLSEERQVTCKWMPH